MTTAQHADDIEALKLLMARYAHWGDTQQWDKFGSLFHDDAVIIVDAGPRPDPEADPRIEVHGREAFITGMSASLDGVHTAHNLFLPEITIHDDTHAHATWGLHDYVKTPVVNFNGYGHISHDYVKVDGQWKIIRGRTTRIIVDEQWLTDAAGGIDPKTVVREFWETYGRGQLDEAWRKYLAENIIVHAPPPMELNRESWLATEKAFFTAFDDIDVKVLDQVAEGDKVASRWSMTARQTAEFYGVPSCGRTATVTGTYVDVIRDDKIVEHWSEMSLPQFMQALSAE